MCVGGGEGVASSSFLFLCQGWPHHPPVPKPEPQALSSLPFPGLPAPSLTGYLLS